MLDAFHVVKVGIAAVGESAVEKSGVRIAAARPAHTRINLLGRYDAAGARRIEDGSVDIAICAVSRLRNGAR